MWPDLALTRVLAGFPTLQDISGLGSAYAEFADVLRANPAGFYPFAACLDLGNLMEVKLHPFFRMAVFGRSKLLNCEQLSQHAVV